MKLQRTYSPEFENALNSLVNPDVKRSIQQKLDDYSESIKNGRGLFYSEALQPYKFKLKYNAESSLFAFLISDNLGLIASLDDDPLFDQTIFNIYDLVSKDQIDNAYFRIGQQIYKEESMLA